MCMGLFSAEELHQRPEKERIHRVFFPSVHLVPVQVPGIFPEYRIKYFRSCARTIAFRKSSVVRCGVVGIFMMILLLGNFAYTAPGQRSRRIITVAWTGQTVTQSPQPRHEAGLYSIRPSSKVRASKIHLSTHLPQSVQDSVSVTATYSERTTRSRRLYSFMSRRSWQQQGQQLQSAYISLSGW